MPVRPPPRSPPFWRRRRGGPPPKPELAEIHGRATRHDLAVHGKKPRHPRLVPPPWAGKKAIAPWQWAAFPHAMAQADNTDTEEDG